MSARLPMRLSQGLGESGMYMDTDGIVEVPDGVTELSDFFHTNPHHGKTYTEMTREIRQVATLLLFYVVWLAAAILTR
ncbi:hypothetical protein GFY24_36130 [Nocardia sp. SYP-A9097]|uniref:hypothetical protein n=1 Tax=Nocardia sp. SYP-A9097 TaxID=2663237 RepID=UPI00129B03D4|nr:hypothetical protein [Nocardia sp. SYP-A9097]MRH92787.1 hypothetical protein [Nocardia sp. SYP-A9097]